MRLPNPTFLLITSLLAVPTLAQTYVTFAVPGANGTVVGGLNNNGDVTGFWSDGTSNHGFVRTAAGAITTFDPQGSVNTTPYAINVAGVITGSFFDENQTEHGFVRDAQGEITSFDVPGATQTLSVSINASGQIAGSYADASGSQGFERAVVARL